jgi:hypothetical protein
MAGIGKELDRPPRRAHRRYKDDEERPRTLGHHRSLPKRNFLSGVPHAVNSKAVWREAALAGHSRIPSTAVILIRALILGDLTKKQIDQLHD